MDDTRLGRSADILEGTAAIKSSLDKLEESASESLMMVSQEKGKVLHKVLSIHMQCYSPEATITAEEDPAILVDKRSLEHVTKRETQKNGFGYGGI